MDRLRGAFVQIKGELVNPRSQGIELDVGAFSYTRIKNDCLNFLFLHPKPLEFHHVTYF